MSRIRSVPRRRLAASFAVVAVTLAACGGAADDAGGTTAPVATTAAGPTDVDDTASDDTAPVTDVDDTAPAAGDTNDDTNGDTNGADSSDAIDRDALPPVFRLSGPTIDGGTIDLAEYADQPLLLWFWAPF